ncbi:hypothetical protein A6A27_36595 [Micromonospora sp. CB01531]|nr:hypothetical protein A6A27_36595 [Micromonospora sp. CB01531]
MTRWGFLIRTRSRIPVSFSTAIPRPVRAASVTMLLAMVWLMFATCRVSFRRRRARSRFADLVPCSCNRFLSRCWRRR